MKKLIAFCLVLLLSITAGGKTLSDLIHQLVTDPAAAQQLRDAITKSGGNLSYELATVIPAGTDLAKFPFAANTQYVTEPGASYTCTPTFALNSPGVSIIASGNSLTIPNVAGAGTAIELHGPGTTFSGFTVVAAPSTATLVRVFAADCNLDITTNVQVGICVKVEPFADRLNARFVAKVPTGGQGAYSVGAKDVTFHDCVHVGSQGEDCIRFSADSAAPIGTGQRPARCKVINSALSVMPKQVGDKQSATISFRDVDESCEASGNTLSGWVRAGQTANVVTATGLKFNNNHCLKEPHGFDQLVLIAASMVQCDSNTFDVDAAQRPIGFTVSVSKPCVPTNNKVKLSAPGITRKKLMIGSNGTGETDGTNTTVLQP